MCAVQHDVAFAVVLHISEPGKAKDSESSPDFALRKMCSISVWHWLYRHGLARSKTSGSSIAAGG